MTEFLDEELAAGRIRVNRIGETATFHDPCQIVRRGGLEAADAARGREPSKRACEDKQLVERIRRGQRKHRGRYGRRRMTREIG